jgi:2-succinyl-5-enolpyruvyl-6-hydroxy-3-cyclohexene-1-carboxylate synthase
LLTTGTSTVSKNLKLFLRSYKPKYHFHISETGDIADPFQTQPFLIKGQIHQVLANLYWENLDTEYINLWKQWDAKISEVTEAYFSKVEFGEFPAVNKILGALPQKSILQLANSMAVRWVNLLGVPNTVWNVYSNRGVSGIDGCTSTAVGAAYIDNEAMNKWKKTTGECCITLLTGDVAFFYDSNALWNKFAPHNLRIIVLNNGGGAIFRLIDGPGQMPEREEFLETRHNRNARLLCEDMHVGYAKAGNFEELETELEKFYQPSTTPKVLEVFTDAEINTQQFKEYKELIYGLENI